MAENPSVTRFREYLRINTMQPNPTYDKAVDYFRKQAESIGLEFEVYDTGLKDKPMVRVSWIGTKPEKKSIMLLSHMDVVPVFPEHWTYEPFSAHKDEKGDIYARGSQDMKCVSIWYLEAIRRLKAEGRKFPRTIHMIFSSDEEIGGSPTAAFVKSQAYKDLNGQYGLDEGIAHVGPKIKVFYGERSTWWLKITCNGSPGHGSSFIENSAGKKIQYIINKFYDLRDEQEKLWKSKPGQGAGNFTCANLTVLEGGVQPNVLPQKLSAVFDIRVPPKTDFRAFQKQIRGWCDEAGKDVEIEYLDYSESSEMCKLEESNPFWMAFKSACEDANVQIQPEIFPAGTDSRMHRKVGLEVLGFSPMPNTPQLLHDHDEYLNENVFIEGINTYCHIIPALASLP